MRTHSIIEYPNEFKDQLIPYTIQVDLYLVGKLIANIQNVFEIDQKILKLINSAPNNLCLLDFKNINLNAKIFLEYLNDITLE